MRGVDVVVPDGGERLRRLRLTVPEHDQPRRRGGRARGRRARGLRAGVRRVAGSGLGATRSGAAANCRSANSASTASFPPARIAVTTAAPTPGRDLALLSLPVAERGALGAPGRRGYARSPRHPASRSSILAGALTAAASFGDAPENPT